jgi:hypothetical protein
VLSSQLRLSAIGSDLETRLMVDVVEARRQQPRDDICALTPATYASEL